MELRRILYGYRKEQFNFYVVPEEALIVREIFKEYVDGKPLKAIAESLTERQVVYYKDKTDWTKNAVCRILENKHYIGDTEYPKIIDENVFLNAENLRLSKGGKREKDSDEVVYLKTHLFCEVCGNRFMRRAKYTDHERWVCENKCHRSYEYLDDKILVNKINGILHFVKDNPSFLMTKSQVKPYTPTREVILKEKQVKDMIFEPSPLFQPIKSLIYSSIYRSFLDGMSTHGIAKQLEKNNVKTFNGKDKWNQSVIMNILQNEKYCGDVMYQKTYIVDCISKKQLVNHGKRDRYLVYNDHEPIISRELYYEAQAEFARRKTKRSTSDLAKTGIGRYSSKYAFSELLVCKECGGHFRRKTVKKKDGTMHYWRCINRLDYADKYCTNSVGFEENALKNAVCNALSEVVQKRSKGMELVKSHLVYVASADDKSDDLYFIDKAIKDEEQHIVELANLALKSPQNRENYESAISDCTERIKVLRERREEIVKQLNFNEAAKAEIERIEKYLTEDRAVFTEFDDCTVRRLVNSISVSKDLELTI